jgi:hypothetical protein
MLDEGSSMLMDAEEGRYGVAVGVTPLSASELGDAVGAEYTIASEIRADS